MPKDNLIAFSARRRLIVVAISACFASAPAWSNPTAPQVVNGSASFSQAGNLLTVNNTNGAIINWNTFSIGANETTRFIQNSAASSVLNRVISNDPSALLGTLSSNGKVWLVNPAGIMVGQGARIDVAGFVASTLNVRNEDFLAGRLNFGATPGAGKIENRGQITTPSGGSVYLVAPAVENHGVINAPNGEVILAAGQTAQLVDTGTPGVKVNITGAEGNVTNLGEIISEAGRIGMAGVLVKNSGTLNASSVVKEGGRIFLKASQDAYVDGSGRIVATGTKGGSIEVLGDRVAVMDQAQLDASGGAGGGTVLVGGDAHGANPDVQNASITYFGPQASIRADAIANGDGGKVIVWADDTTRAYGAISARGGAQSGNGGFVETSGANLDVAGIRVHAAAPNGTPGLWLLDPTTVTIDHVTGAGTINGSGVFNPSVSTTLHDRDINATLNDGTSVTVRTSGGTDGNGDITLNGTADSGGAAAILDSGGGSRSLSLIADRNIVMRAGSSISGSSGNPLSVILNSNAGVIGYGNVQMFPGSSISTFGGDIVMGGGADPTTGAATGNPGLGADPRSHGIYLEGATLSSGAGSISLIGKGGAGTSDTNVGVALVSGTSISATGGTITIDGTAGTGTVDNRGIYMPDGSITSTNGDISITGTGAAGPISVGIMLGGQVVSTGTAEINLAGTNVGGGVHNSAGVWLGGSGMVKSTNGAISITGTASGLGSNYGIWLMQNHNIISDGLATITLEGTGSSTSAGINLAPSSVGTIGGPSATGAVSLTALTNDIALSAVKIGGAGSATLAAAGNIVLNGVTISGSSGHPLDVTLQARASGAAQGNVQISDSDISSYGGNVVIGGGSDPSTMPAIGYGTLDGVLIHGSGTSPGYWINANGGDITINGQGSSGTAVPGGRGVQINNGAWVTTTGAGAISISGKGASGNEAILIKDASNTTIATETGALTLDGSGNGSDGGYGVRVWNGATVKTTTGTLTITGQGGTGYGGVRIESSDTLVGTDAGGHGLIAAAAGTGYGNGLEIVSGAKLRGSTLALKTTNGDVYQDTSSPLEVTNLAIDAAGTVDMQAPNKAGTLAGSAYGSFVFSNDQPLTIGSVAGFGAVPSYNGLSVGAGYTLDGREGANIRVQVTNGSLTVNQPVVADALNDYTYSENGGAGSVYLSATGIAVTSSITAYGGVGSVSSSTRGEGGDLVFRGAGGDARIKLDGGSGPIELDGATLYAQGGDSNAFDGGAARIRLATSGTIALTHSSLSAYGGAGNGGDHNYYDIDDSSYVLGSGGKATVKLSAGSGVAVQDGSTIEAYGGSGYGYYNYSDAGDNVVYSGAGGNARIRLDGGTGPIVLDGATIYAQGGESQNFNGGGARVALATAGSGTITLQNGSSIAAEGGSSGNSYSYNDVSQGELGYIGSGGDAKVRLTTETGGISLTSSAITAEGGYGAASTNYTNAASEVVYPGAGGKATIRLDGGTGGVLLDSATLHAQGGDSDNYIGGAARIKLITSGSSGITVQNNSTIEAQGGEDSSDGIYYDAASGQQIYLTNGGKATVRLDGGTGPILLDHASITATGGDGGEGNGGAARVKLTTSGGGISVQNASQINAYGGYSYGYNSYYNSACDCYVYPGLGGRATITLDGGAGNILVDHASLYAQGGDSAYFNGGSAKIRLTTSDTGGITVSGGSNIGAQGGTAWSDDTYYVAQGEGGDWLYLGSGGSARVKLTSGSGGIALTGANEIAAYGGTGHGSDSFDDGNGNTVYSGYGGSAKVKLDGGSGAILLDASSSIRAYGGDSDSRAGGDALAKLTAYGNIAMQSGTQVTALGGDCSSECDGGYATVGIASANGSIAGGVLAGDAIQLNALKGIGQVGNPVRIASSYASVAACNGSDVGCAGAVAGAAGDIALSQVTGNVSIDSYIGSVINRAPNGGYDFTAEGGDVALNGSLAANGSGSIGLHAAGSVVVSGTITTHGGPIVLNSDTGGDTACNIQLLAGGALSSNGGSIVMGGGSDPLTGYAHGSGSTQATASGIYIAGDINAGAGNVTMHGQGAAGFLPADGIAFVGGTLTSNGTVTIDGIAQASHANGGCVGVCDFVAGVHFANPGVRLTTATGTVNVTGLNSVAGVRAQGVTIDAATIETTGTGTLTLNGTSTPLPDTSWGVGILFGGTVRSTAAGGGRLTITGAASPADGGVILLGGNVTSAGGDVRLTSLAGGMAFDSSSLVGGPTSGDILMKVGDVSPIIVSNGSIVNAGTSALTLALSGGAASDNNNAITAGALRLLGSGTFNLGGSNNTVGTLAGNVTGSVTYRNTSGLAIGSVTSFDGTATTTTAGVTANGPVTVRSGGGIAIGSAGYVSSAAAGNAITLVSGGAFTNNNATNPLSAPNGRWLVYAPDPGGVTKNGLISAFRHYNATSANYANPLEPGNGFIYASTPGVITVDTTLTSGTASNTFGQAPTAVFGYTLVGSVDKEDISGTATFTPTISTTTNAGSYNIAYAGGLVSATPYSGTGLANPVSYTINSGNGLPYTVNPATLAAITAGLTGTASKTYDGTTTATLAPGNFLLSGFVNSDSASVTKTTGAYGSKNVGSGIAVSTSLASSDFSPVGSTNLSNYTLPTSASGNIGVITPASVTVSGLAAQNKAYDATTAATVTGGALAGVIAGDAVSLTSPTANFNNKNVGTAKPVTVTGLTLSGVDAGNYSLTPSVPALTANITAAPLSVTGISANNKVYDASTAANLSGGTLTGVLAGDVVNMTPVGSFNNKNVGVAKPVTVTGLGLTGADAGNYSFTPPTGVALTADITPASLTVSGLTAQNKVYDATTAATVTAGTLKGVFASDTVSVAASTAAFNNKNVGSAKPVTVTGLTLTGADAGNYSFTPPTGVTLTADITPASLTVSGITAQNKVYDGTTVATIAGTAAFSGVLGSDVVTLGGSASASFGDKNVGIAKPVNVTGLTLAGADAGNYVINTKAAATADITPASVTLSGVSAANKVYDGTIIASVSGGSLSGLIGGDAVSVSGTGAFADKNVGAAKPVNVSGITLTGTDAGNYKLSGTTTATTAADITVRPLSTWKGGASGNWSVAANWDALPDLSNVLAVSVPAGTVTYDAAAGSTNLATLTAAGLNVAGGSLNIANSLTVSSSFSQTGGTLGMGSGANASITQVSGNLNVPALTLANLSLAAPAGAITQSGAIVATVLNTQSQTGATLNNAGNRIASFGAVNSGSGNVTLTNTGALTITGISNTVGSIAIDNTGAVTTVGQVIASNGPVTIVGHSPVTIGAGGVSASGDIVLTAGNTAGSGDDLTLSGPVSSTGTGGSVSLTSGDNLLQSANVTTSGGAISATAQTGNIVLTSLNAGGGSITLNAGNSIQSAPGYAGANLIGGKAVIVAGGNANLSTQVKQLDVTVAGRFSIADSLTGAVITDVPAAETLSTAAQVHDQVLSTITATTQQQPISMTTQAPPPPAPPATTASGSSGSLLQGSTTQTIGGAEGTFGGSSGAPASGQSDKPADDKSASAKKDDKKDDAKKKEDEAPAKKDGKPAPKKLATCS